MHDLWPKVVEETKTQNPLELCAWQRWEITQANHNFECDYKSCFTLIFIKHRYHIRKYKRYLDDPSVPVPKSTKLDRLANRNATQIIVREGLNGVSYMSFVPEITRFWRVCFSIRIRERLSVSNVQRRLSWVSWVKALKIAQLRLKVTLLHHTVFDYWVIPTHQCDNEMSSEYIITSNVICGVAITGLVLWKYVQGEPLLSWSVGCCWLWFVIQAAMFRPSTTFPKDIALFWLSTTNLLGLVKDPESPLWCRSEWIVKHTVPCVLNDLSSWERLESLCHKKLTCI